MTLVNTALFPTLQHLFITSDQKDLDPIPEIVPTEVSWEQAYDEGLEFRIVPNGQSVQEKLQKAAYRVFMQQQKELEKTKIAINEDKCTLSDETKYNKAFHLGSMTYDEDSVTREDYEDNNVYHLASQGARDEQQDWTYNSFRSVKFGSGKEMVKMTALFDGHSSEDCAEYATSNIWPLLKKNLKRFNQKEKTDAGFWNAFKITLVELDREYTGPESGTTANICMQVGNALWTANVGDSRSILIDVTDGYTFQLSEDQKATDPNYTSGIEKRGGEIKDDRLNGGINMARRVGSHIDPRDVHTSARPKITKFHLKEGHKYVLIQASDGLWDVMSTNHVGDFMLQRMRDGDSLPAATYDLVAAATTTFGSEDNTTILSRIWDQP